MRCSAIGAVLVAVAAAAPAAAQPADPYGAPSSPAAGSAAPAAPSPGDRLQDPYDTTAKDPALAESVASALVDRAQDLFDARELGDAKQLAVEAIATAPSGPAAERAKQILASIDGPPRRDNVTVTDDKIEAPPALGSGAAPRDEVTPPGGHGARVEASVYAGLLGGAIGSTIGTAFTSDPNGQVTAAIAGGAVAAAAGILFVAPWLDRTLNAAQVHPVGAGAVWGGIIGGLMANISTGTDPQGTSTQSVMIGTSIGATVFTLGSYALARRDDFTVGDVALIDTMAGIGGIGGFTVGLIMQPAQYEAYEINAVVGIATGVIVGMIYAPQTNTTPRRMLRVAGLAALGAGVPLLLDPAGVDDTLVGLLATGGLVAGTYLGFRWTAHMDEGLDRKPGKADAPAAVVGRSSDGSWAFGGLGIQPLSPKLDNHQRGQTFTVLSGSF
jgi:hypothetical protein